MLEIFGLIQIALIPHFMIQPPERLALRLPPLDHSRKLVRPHLQSREPEQIKTLRSKTSVSSMVAYARGIRFPVSGEKFPVKRLIVPCSDTY
jgi:hypothetical protein